MHAIALPVSNLVNRYDMDVCVRQGASHASMNSVSTKTMRRAKDWNQGVEIEIWKEIEK